jgi:sec-independent protein translocase protein TatA
MSIGAPEVILVLAILLLLFGARKLPELSRGLGRSLRIFKAETKGLIEDDEPARSPAADAPSRTESQRQIEPVSRLDSERIDRPEREGEDRSAGFDR